MLYTRKGDDGTTKTFGCDQKISKGSLIADTLGSLDELNSFLGLVKVQSKYNDTLILESQIKELHEMFVDFAILVEQQGEHIDNIEKQLPPIKTFFVSGGSEVAALFDISRTIARGTERVVVSYGKISKESLAYLNRISSLLYALARLSNHLLGIKEDTPKYK